MRAILIACALILVAGIVTIIVWTRPSAHYGEPFRNLPLVALVDLAASPAKYRDHEVRVRGRIVRQCPITGCWFYLEQEDGKPSPIKIELESAHLPRKQGAMVTVEGRFTSVGDEQRIAASAIIFGKE